MILPDYSACTMAVDAPEPGTLIEFTCDNVQWDMLAHLPNEHSMRASERANASYSDLTPSECIKSGPIYDQLCIMAPPP
jgi:hypothetical protein